MATIQELLTNIQNAKYGREVRGSIYQALSQFWDQVSNAFVHKRQLTESDDINDEEFYRPGMWTAVASGIPQNWAPQVGAGRLLVFGAESSNRAYKAQLIFGYASDNVYWRMGQVSGWTDWFPLGGGDVVSKKGALTAEDDLDTIYENGVWSVNNSNSYPAHYPNSTGLGIVLALGAEGSSSTSCKTQLVFKGTSNEVWYRNGKIASNTWNDWAQLSGGNIVAYNRALTSNDDIDSPEFYRSGMYSVTTDRPQNYPENVGIGKFIVFGAESDNRALKAQVIQTLNTDQIYWRMGRSNGWGDWNMLNSSPVPADYVAFGASTTEGRTGDDQSRISPHPYPFYVGKLGNFQKWVNLAHGGTGVIWRNGINDDNHLDAVTITTVENPDLVATLHNAGLITLNIGYNDRHAAFGGASMFAGHLVADFSDIMNEYIGHYYDYFSYDRSTMYSATSDGKQMAANALYGIWGVSKGQGCTICGGWNYILNYITNHFPQAQIALITPVKSYDEIKQVTINRTNHTIRYTEKGTDYWYEQAQEYEATHTDNPTATNDARSAYARCLWSDKILAAVSVIAENANVPIIDPNPAFITPLHTESDKYARGSHPTYDEYDYYSRSIAAQILAKFRN